MNLLLVRSAARERELAVRAALGGSRWRLVRQMLTESVVLAAAAVTLGIALAYLGIRLLVTLGPEKLPRLDDVRIDPIVVTFAAFAGILAIVLVGLLPALRASRPDLMNVLRTAGRSGGLSAGSWLRNAVVTIEVALSFVLLVGSGLMMRSFIALHRADPGYDPNGVLTFSIPNIRIPDQQARAAFMRDLKARLEALPGVAGATAANPMPLDGGSQSGRYGTEEALADATKFQQATVHFVLPGYFDVMRTKVIEGRTVAEADNHPDGRVVVIDRVLAAKTFPGTSPVGKTLLLRIRTDEPERFQVIGVVDHQRHTTIAADGREGLFVPDGYVFHGAANRWIVRTTVDPMAVAAPAQAAVRALNPRTAAVDAQPYQTFVDDARAPTRFALTLIGVFAGIALVLAAVGLYSVLSTGVRQRTAEIGVRMAFGAANGSIFRMMVGQGLRLSAVGLALGLASAWFLTSLMQTMLVGVEPTDPATFAAMTAGFLAVAAVACAVPALRAARLDPVEALRAE